MPDHISGADPRFQQAVRLFNEREFFACHDELEEVWSETLGESREFYQGLIHSAVALFHFGEGNLGGARKMYCSARRYLEPYGPVYGGVAVDKLLQDLRCCFAELQAATGDYPHEIELDETRIPRLRLVEDEHP